MREHRLPNDAVFLVGNIEVLCEADSDGPGTALHHGLACNAHAVQLRNLVGGQVVRVISVGVGAFERETGILDEGRKRDDFVLADCLAWEVGVTRNSD